MRTMFKRSIAAGVAAAVLATSLPAVPAFAASAKQPGIHSGAAVAVSEDFSARRRHYYRGRNNAAALAIFGGALATFGAIAAAQERRDYYRNNGYYGYGYAPAPYGYYGPRYYRY